MIQSYIQVLIPVQFPPAVLNSSTETITEGVLPLLAQFLTPNAKCEVSIIVRSDDGLASCEANVV
jgi:hypothetical protein